MGTGTTVICDTSTYTGAGDGTEAVPGEDTVTYFTATTSNAALNLNDLWLNNPNNGVFWQNNTTAPIVSTLTMNGGSITLSDNVQNRSGIRHERLGEASAGERVTLNDDATITVEVANSSRGIFVTQNSPSASGDLTIEMNDNSRISVIGGGGGTNVVGAWASMQGAGAMGDAVVTLNDSARIENVGGASSHAAFALISGANNSGDAVTTANGAARVSTAGPNSVGLFSWISGANSAGSARVTMRGAATAATTGASAPAAFAWISGAGATGDARVTVLGSAGITTEGERSAGVNALTASTTATGDAVVSLGESASIVTQGLEAHGAIATNQGTGQAIIGMTSGTISTSGANADGLVAVNSGTGRFEVTMNGGSVISGTDAAASIRTASANGGTIDISAAAVVDGSASGIAIRDGDIDRDGTDETGGNVTVTSAGTVTGDAILGLGDDVFILSGGLFDGDIYGDDIAASAADGDDTFIWTGGVWRSGFFGGNGSDTATISAADYDGTHHVLDGGDDTSAADGWIDTLTLSGLTANANGVNIRNWEILRLVGTRLTILDGALAVGAEAGLGLSLTDTATLDGGEALALTGNLSIDTTSTFVATGGGAGVYTISGDLTNDGLVTLQDGAAGDRLTIAGNQLGTGQLALDIDTATGAGDRVIIQGDKLGTTIVALNNLSPGESNGQSITLMEVAGEGSGFALAAGPLTAGAFSYDLVIGSGIIALAGTLNDRGIVYGAVPAALSALLEMPTLEQRLSAGAGSVRQADRGPWLRLHGDQTEMTTATGGAIESTTSGLQAGWNFDCACEWLLGVTGQYSAQAGSVAGAGKIDSTSVGIGATATWLGEDGRYIDLQGQINLIDTDLSATTAGTLAAGRRSTASAVSVEGGWRHPLDEKGSLVPQAQLTLARLDGAHFTDSAGNAIDFGTQTDLIGRLGVAYDWENTGPTGESLQKLRVIVNVLHDFSGTGTVDVAGTGIGATTADTWGEIGFGASVTLGEATVIYGEASLRTSLGNAPESSRGQAITAGIRHSW